MSTRRLPVYIVADCSGSMAGDKIESVKTGIRTLHSDLMGDPQAIESAYLSLITFSAEAQQAVPLTELSAFVTPDLRADGGTSLGKALRLLHDRIQAEVATKSSDRRGDWRPLVFLFTDGQPTDEWEAPADEIKRARPGNIIAVACGHDADADMLKRITETVLVMREVTPESFRKFFAWISHSIKQTSSKASAAAGTGVALPTPPPTIVVHP